MLVSWYRGSVAEWLMAPVLKTGIRRRIVSSNLTASANTKKPIVKQLVF